jgi:hypothetical protein
MKKLIVFFLSAFVALLVNAQTTRYGNEWINYNQKYFYFKVAKDDIYRINASALSAIEGFPLSTLDHRRLQIFGRTELGDKIEEITIFVQDNNGNNILDGNDFVEFFAKKNDGYFDKGFYKDPQDQPNPHYSLINDTAIYYITWNNSINNKRMTLEEDNNFSSYTPTPYFIRKVVQNYTSTYHSGGWITWGAAETDPDFTKNQGWFDTHLASGSYIKELNISNVSLTGPMATLQTVVIGLSRVEHGVMIEYQNNDGSYTLLDQYQFNSFDRIITNKSILPSSLGSPLRLRFNFTGGNKTLAYTSIEYPQIPNLSNATSLKFTVPDEKNQLKSYFQFSNLNVSGDAWVYDLTNQKKIRVYQEIGQFRVLIHNSPQNEDKICFITSSNNIAAISQIKPVGVGGNFINYNNSNADYLIITHQSLLSGAQAYSEYRKTRGFQTVVVDVEQLYHQFGSGIEKHPLAIKNFADMALNSWNRKPQHLFLVGKSVSSQRSRGNNIPAFHANLVPSYGAPASDNMLTAGLNGTKWEPAIATGRIAARTNQQVLDYFNKIKDFEGYSLPEEWMKTILHFGGGSDVNEQNEIKRHLRIYQKIIEGPLFGGNVKEFYKSSSAVIDITLADSIRKLVNEGISIMTFFGHASGSGFDINIDEPETYQNSKKYPLLIANSCYVGDIHGNEAQTTSEKFVLIPNKGVIGFIAHVNFGFLETLSDYTQNLYRSIALRSYGESIGKGMIEAIKNYQLFEAPLVKAQALYMTLHGDPALVINSFPKPDIKVSQPDIYFSPSYVTSDLDSFKVNVILTNLAKVFNDEFDVELTRRFPDGTSEKLIQSVNGLMFKDTIVFTLSVNSIKGPGENIFDVFADPLNQVDEMTKANNKTTTTFEIFSNDIVPVYPYPFAVVPNQGITLKAVTSNTLASTRKYVIEIDTTDFYNSPLKQRQEFTTSGGVIRWSPALLQNIKDSTVFFWRTSPDSASSSDYVWRESTFQYIPNKSGWGQAHFFQFKNNVFNSLRYNRNSREFYFETFYKLLFCKNIGNPTIPQSFSIETRLDLVHLESGTCGAAPMIHMMVIDSNDLTPWSIFNHDLGNEKCSSKPLFFRYPITDAYMDSLILGIRSISPGHFVLLYSVWTPEDINHLTFTFLDSLGADPALEQNAKNGHPFIFFFRQGDKSTAQTTIGTHPNDEITLYSNVFRNNSEGSMNSVIVGPAIEWSSFHWDTKSLENPDTDESTVEITTIESDGTENVWKIITQQEKDVLINELDANKYPYIKLKGNFKDISNKTPTKLNSWHILYDEAPEATLNASAYFSFKSDTVEEGNNIKMKIAVENIGRVDMDSLMVSYIVEDAFRNRKQLVYSKLQPLKADSTLITEIDFSSIDLIGKNLLRLEINPKDANWQREQHHFNNILQKDFFVRGDKINPLLDVTFDGTHILDGDIVSTKPLVLIQLKDENKFRALNDTSNFALFLIDPDGNLSKVYFNEGTEEKMRFQPAVLPKNSCRIEWNPKFTKDGEYQLRVQAKDASGNLSGRNEYIISFSVISASSITEVLNYPNPFSTSTRFVFTLTGSEIPSHFKIQIMTVTGKIVKEIHKDELGPIRIGRNISEYAWDGRDEFGDQLANGVYLYRVITRINGSEIERRSSEADNFFHKGFGKMYLLR